MPTKVTEDRAPYIVNTTSAEETPPAIAKPEKSIQPVRHGWICPRCKEVHSPYVKRCHCSGTKGTLPEGTELEKRCLYCKCRFTTRYLGQIYCSAECRNKRWGGRYTDAKK